MIKLEQLPNDNLEIELQVLNDDSLGIDLIIGRDTLNNLNISVWYKPVGSLLGRNGYFVCAVADMNQCY